MTVAPCPLQHCTVEDSSTQAPEQLSVACAELQQWLTQVLLQPGAAQTPVMRNFLCAEANLPPPDLNVTWVRQSRSSLDEVCGAPSPRTVFPLPGARAEQKRARAARQMEMDELFDRHLDEKEVQDDFEDSELAETMTEEVTQLATSGDGLGMEMAAPLPPPPSAIFPPPAGGAGAGGAGDEPAGLQHCRLSRKGSQYSFDSFKTIRVIGKGSFGKVFLVREKTTGQIFAMKVLQKENIIKRNQVRATARPRLSVTWPNRGSCVCPLAGRAHENRAQCAGLCEAPVYRRLEHGLSDARQTLLRARLLRWRRAIFSPGARMSLCVPVPKSVSVLMSRQNVSRKNAPPDAGQARQVSGAARSLLRRRDHARA